MLRRRSRPVPTNSKQQQHHIISDQNTHFSPPQEKPKKTPTSSFLNLTKIFKLFFINEIQTSKIMSPTLILDTKPFSILAKTLKKHSWEYPQESKGIGLAIVDEIANSEPKSSKMNPKLVLFGSQFKTHVALPSEFGIDRPRSDFSSSSGQIGVDANEMEHSEDYTCVISHGPNPRTTHIFGNSIVKTCNKVNGSSSLRQQQTQYHKGSRQSRVYNGSSSLQQQQTYEASHQSRVWTGSSSLKQEQTQCHKDSHQSRVCDGSSSLSTKIQKNYNFPEILSSYSPQNFLSCCCFCKKRLGQGQDIYMYRGEKAFCSQECRCQGMLFDDDDEFRS